ncbi:MAG: hypothetical protein ACRCTE_13710 [Cellulosilyticaceae bacterium]
MHLDRYKHYSKESSFFEVLSLPPHKPDLSRILDTAIIPTVVDYSFIESTQGLSYEGQMLSGITLAINLSLTEKLTYMSHTSTETVHSIHYTSMRSLSIVLPQQVGGIDTLSVIKSGTFTIYPSIEHIHSKVADSRTIHQVTLLLVTITLR